MYFKNDAALDIFMYEFFRQNLGSMNPWRLRSLSASSVGESIIKKSAHCNILRTMKVQKGWTMRKKSGRVKKVRQCKKGGHLNCPTRIDDALIRRETAVGTNAAAVKVGEALGNILEHRLLEGHVKLDVWVGQDVVKRSCARGR
jgi:hypothetical protein